MTTRKSKINDSLTTNRCLTKIRRIEGSTSENGSTSLSFSPISIYQNDKINRCADVILVAGPKRIPAHRRMLGAASDYFATKFKNDIEGSIEDERVIVDVDGDALITLVLYCYTGCIELHEGNLPTLLRAAHRLKFDAVIGACCLLLTEQLNPSNCLGIKKLADGEDCVELSRAAEAYTLKNFLQVVKNPEYLLLSVQEVAKLLGSEDLIVPSEKKIFHALMTWLQHHPKNRFKDANMLLRCVKLPLLSPAFIADHIESNEIFSSQWIPQDLIKEEFTIHYSAEYLQDVLLAIGVAILDDILYAVGGENRSSSLETVEKWDPIFEQWSFVAPMSSRRSGIGVAALNNKIYAVGGSIGHAYLNTMECYDPRTNKWNFCASMSTARAHMGICVLNEQLYVLGGQTPSGNSNSVERYDPETDTWSTIAAISEARSRIGVTALGGRLFAVGGWNGRKTLTIVEAYDPHLNEWQKIATSKIFSKVHCLVIEKSILQT